MNFKNFKMKSQTILKSLKPVDRSMYFVVIFVVIFIFILLSHFEGT